MLTLHHEMIGELIRQHPAVLAALLRERHAIDVPDATRVRALDTHATQMRPIELDADVVLQFGDVPPDADNARVQRVLNVIVEVQRDRDDDKASSWPLYHAELRRRHGGEVLLVVVATNTRTARWARRAIDIGQPASRFVPLVVGPEEVPVLDFDAAQQQPQLAMLSALVHLEHDDRVAIAVSALVAWFRFDPGTAVHYLDTITSQLSEADRELLVEALMQHTDKNPFRSEWLRKAYVEIRDELRDEVKDEVAREVRDEVAREVRDEVAREVRDEVAREVRDETFAEALVTVLEARGLAPTDTERAQMLSCRDQATLQAWARRVATVASVGELLDET